MADQPKYVIDSVFGGAVPWEVVASDGDSEALIEGGEPVWPKIPPEYELPAPEHEKAIKECMLYEYNTH